MYCIRKLCSTCANVLLIRTLLCAVDQTPVLVGYYLREGVYFIGKLADRMQ